MSAQVEAVPVVACLAAFWDGVASLTPWLFHYRWKFTRYPLDSDWVGLVAVGDKTNNPFRLIRTFNSLFGWPLVFTV